MGEATSALARGASASDPVRSATASVLAAAAEALGEAKAPDAAATHVLAALLAATDGDVLMLLERDSEPSTRAPLRVTMLTGDDRGRPDVDAAGRVGDADLVHALRDWAATHLRLGPARLTRACRPFQHVAVLPLRAGETLEALVCLGRRAGDFAEEAVAVLDAVQGTAHAMVAAARQDRARRRAEGVLHDAIDNNTSAVALFDAEDRLLVHNRRYLELFPFLGALGALAGRSFAEMVRIPGGERSWTEDAEAYCDARLARHHAADGTPFDIPTEAGGWVRVCERRTASGGIVATWTDISPLKAAEERLMNVLASLTEGFVLLDATLSIVLCNAPFRAMHAVSSHLLVTGVPFEDVLRHALRHGQFPDASAAPEAFIETMLASFRGQEPVRTEVRVAADRWLLVSNRGMADGGGIGVWTDVTEQRRREEDLRRAHAGLERQKVELTELAVAFAGQARIDRLTGLPNRFAFEEQIAAAWREMLAGGRTHTLLYLDLDQFKTVNDMCGHAAGDKLLRRVAQLLRKGLDDRHFLARLGGDEFGVILRDADETEARPLATQLCEAVRDFRFSHHDKVFAIGLSVGIARLAAGAVDVAGLVARADAACYAAKSSGGGRVFVFDAEDALSPDEVLSSGERLRTALIEGRFEVWLQRIVDAAGATRGHEALVRMVDAAGNRLAPDAFMPAAARFNMMTKLDQWVCCEVIRLLTPHRSDAALGMATLGFVSINISARSLADGRFQAWLIATVEQVGWLGGLLRIEITEGGRLPRTSAVTAFLHELRRRGIRLYIDDFGASYDLFDLAKHMPLDGIKVDPAIVGGVLDDPVDLALLKASLSVADSLGCDLVAEGVETEPVRDRLRQLGVPSFQGYLFHRPELFAQTIPQG